MQLVEIIVTTKTAPDAVATAHAFVRSINKTPLILHDGSAGFLVNAAAPDVVMVVIANRGGQIFSMLDHARLPELDELFVTPHPAEIADVCGAAGVGHRLVDRSRDLVPALERAARDGAPGDRWRPSRHHTDGAPRCATPWP
jgi:hypothetical protein